MKDTTTVTVRTQKKTKKQAQQFFDGLWISLSSAINMFLNDVVHNKRLSFNIEPFKLIPVAYNDLPNEVKTSYQEIEKMQDNDFVYFTRWNNENS